MIVFASLQNYLTSLWRLPYQCPKRKIMILQKNVHISGRVHSNPCVLKTSWLKTVFFCRTGKNIQFGKEAVTILVVDTWRNSLSINKWSESMVWIWSFGLLPKLIFYYCSITAGEERLRLSTFPFLSSSFVLLSLVVVEGGGRGMGVLELTFRELLPEVTLVFDILK